MPELADVSDTALWMATFRARESVRRDALFRDPLAGVLAGPEGPRIVRSLGSLAGISGGVVVRTVAFDEFVRTSLQYRGIDAVINLGAGLDTRPYRMDLPSWLPWWEIDLPRLLDFKEARLAHEKPRCDLRRIRIDLKDAARRAEILGEIAKQCRRALVITEGLLAYLAPGDVSALASELHGIPSFEFWAADLVAHKSLDVTRLRSVGMSLAQAGAPLLFAPEEGVAFFEPLGWTLLEIRNPITEAFRLRRVPWFAGVLKPLIQRSPIGSAHLAAWAKAGSVLLQRNASLGASAPPPA
jgi:methyltransferase (TIGR00027 family)